MNKFEKALTVLGSLFLIIACIYVLKNPVTAVGSVDLGSDYHSTTTRAVLNANGANAAMITSTINSTQGTLGSVVITGANTGSINLYDETTTAAHTDHATTSIASIPGSTAAGTYTFDAVYFRGLVVEINGNVATSTITYR